MLQDEEKNSKLFLMRMIWLPPHLALAIYWQISTSTHRKDILSEKEAEEREPVPTKEIGAWASSINLSTGE
jgi:hypothetical protein